MTLAFAAALLGAPLYSSLAHAQRGGAPGAESMLPDCPVSLTLPSEWTRVPLLSARVDAERNMRFTYGAGRDDVITLSASVKDASMLRMETNAIKASALMIDEPALTIAGHSVPAMRSKSGDAQQGKGGADAWLFAVPLDGEDLVQIRFTAIAGRGVLPPGTDVLRRVLESIRPGACLVEE